MVSSDHCPFCLEEKQRLGGDDFRLIPNGGPGVEHRMLVVYAEGVAQGRISLEKYLDLTFPVVFPVAVVAATRAEQTVKGAVTYFYCSHREGWCRKGTADLDIAVKR